jgi:hypothetical protein
MVESIDFSCFFFLLKYLLYVLKKQQMVMRMSDLPLTHLSNDELKKSDTCNSSYSGGGDWDDPGSRTACTKSS